ncbi:MAG: ERF family protein, partial [Candidatus Peribacteraceae bacterium]|nr:ERF family protein [Candidatus Peribacteraceae bacterium]
GAVGPISKNKQVKIQTKKGDWIIFKYSDLTEIIKTIRKPLSENGLSVSQTYLPGENGKSCMVTTVYHSSGQYISSSFAMPPWADMKTLGGNMTYLRRYTLSSILALVTDEDIDATELEVKSAPKEEPEKKVEEEEDPDEETTAEWLNRMSKIFKNDEIVEFLRFRSIHLSTTGEKIVNMYKKNDPGFKTDFNAWLAKKEPEGQSEGD